MMNENIDIEQQLREELSRLKRAVDYIAQAEKAVQQAQQLNEKNLSKYDEILKSNEKLKSVIDSRISVLEKKQMDIEANLNKKIINISEEQNQRLTSELKKNQKLIEVFLNKEEILKLHSKTDILSKKYRRNYLFIIILFILCIVSLVLTIVR